MKTYQPDLSQGSDFRFSPLTEDATLLFPKNIVAGMNGNFIFVQDAVGGRKLSLDERYKYVGSEFVVNMNAIERTILRYAVDIDRTVLVLLQ